MPRTLLVKKRGHRAATSKGLASLTQTQFDKRNITMMMDFYELTMANGYFEDHDKDV